MSTALREFAHAPTSNGCLLRTQHHRSALTGQDEIAFLESGTPRLPPEPRPWRILSSTSDTLDDVYSLFTINPAILELVHLDESIQIELRSTSSVPVSHAFGNASLFGLMGAFSEVIEAAPTGIAESIVGMYGTGSVLLQPPNLLIPYVTTSLESRETVDPHGALEDIAKWTRLAPDDLGALWGVARRSIYNWLDGKPIKSAEIADWIVQTYAALRPMEGSRDPLYFRRWLKEGDPSPTTLIQERLWRDLRERVDSERTPLFPVAHIPRVHDDQGVGYGDEALRAISHALQSNTPVAPVLRPTWRPLEITGLGEDEDEEDV